MDSARLVIAGNMSGAGKTTLALGLMAALSQRGLRVQAFKAGPDFVDPAFHRFASGRSSRNIDSWLLNRQTMLYLVSRAAADADISIIEGIMGLYDGRRGLGAEGSTAEMAKWLRAPVVLVLDIGRTAQSAGAMALGFLEFDRDVQIVGAVLNNATNAAHLARATEAVETGAGVPVLGHIWRDPEITLPDQHPALLPAGSSESIRQRIERSRRSIEANVDIQALLDAARSAWPLPPSVGHGPFPSTPRPPRLRLAYFFDEAFDLYQPENLELLAAWGAELVPVSPLRDPALPDDVEGLYIGPGFPEVFAPSLAANVSFLESLRAAAADGMPIYGEGGALTYLSEGVRTRVEHRMAGLIHGWVSPDLPGLQLGYAMAVTERDSLLGPKGTRVRGYQYLGSSLALPPETAAYQLQEPEVRPEGFATERIFASNIRLHFGSENGFTHSMLDSFVRAARSSNAD